MTGVVIGLCVVVLAQSAAIAWLWGVVAVQRRRIDALAEILAKTIKQTSALVAQVARLQ